MSHWNYRIVEYHDGEGFGLHEVYYDDDGEPEMMTTYALFVGCSPEEVRKALMMSRRDANKPVLKEPPEWRTPESANAELDADDIFARRRADRLAYACAAAVQRGDIGERSAIGDALLDYLEIGQPGGLDNVPAWMESYRNRTKSSTSGGLHDE